MKKVFVLRIFRAKIGLKRRASRNVIMLLLMTSLAKERETAVKVLCNVCHIEIFMKWLYERENHVINVNMCNTYKYIRLKINELRSQYMLVTARLN